MASFHSFQFAHHYTLTMLDSNLMFTRNITYFDIEVSIDDDGDFINNLDIIGQIK